MLTLGQISIFFLVKTREYSCNQKLTKENKCINIDPNIGHECERNKQRYYICLELLVKHRSILLFLGRIIRVLTESVITWNSLDMKIRNLPRYSFSFVTFENTLCVARLAGKRMSKHCSNNVETKHYIDTKPFRYKIRNADNENVSQLHNQFLWIFL